MITQCVKHEYKRCTNCIGDITVAGNQFNSEVPFANLIYLGILLLSVWEMPGHGSKSYTSNQWVFLVFFFGGGCRILRMPSRRSIQ